MIRFAVIAAALLVFQSGNAHAADIVGRATVIDGDTIEIHGTRIRLEGIDAFETRQACEREGVPWRCGQQAALALSDLLGQSTVRCTGEQKDRYGRSLATCSVGLVNVNAWMVRQGWALAYRKYSDAYIADEEEAHRQRVGAWDSVFDSPWDYRHRP